MAKAQKLRLIVESAATLTWFAMDATWMFGYKLTVVFALLTAVLHVMLLGLTEYKFSSIMSSLAVNAWVFANVCWMVGDVYDVPMDAAKCGLVLFGTVCLILLTLTDAKRLGWLRGWRNDNN